jgi:hypothetical protein
VNIVKYFISGLFLSIGSASAGSVVDKLNNLAVDNHPPVVFERKQLVEGADSLYFEGVPYQSKPTRIFAYYGTPAGKGPFPAIVLVHGGGGSAFKEWVKKWNEVGFPAISIAVEGQTGTLTGKRPPNKWLKHDWNGPRRPGIYNDYDKPLTDQWMFQYEN